MLYGFWFSLAFSTNRSTCTKQDFIGRSVYTYTWCTSEVPDGVRKSSLLNEIDGENVDSTEIDWK